MAEWRMADIVNERERFGEIGIEIESAGNGARDLRNFQSVREAVAKMIGIARGENLRLGFQSAEGARVDDAVTIAGVVIAIRMRKFGIFAAAANRSHPSHKALAERTELEKCLTCND